MESFTFNNVSSNDLGLIIKEMPPIVRPAKNIETIKVNGRDGSLHIDDGTYDSYNITIKCIVSENANIDLIKSTLIGFGNLILSTVPNRVFNATIKNQIDFSKYLRIMREFPLQMELEPFSIGQSHVLVLLNSNNIEVGGNTDTPPIISIPRQCTITINNTQIQTLADGIKINCELMECIFTQNNSNANAYVVLTEFPKLTPGTNSITIPTGHNVSIIYSDRWL